MVGPKKNRLLIAILLTWAATHPAYAQNSAPANGGLVENMPPASQTSASAPANTPVQAPAETQAQAQALVPVPANTQQTPTPVLAAPSNNMLTGNAAPVQATPQQPAAPASTETVQAPAAKQDVQPSVVAGFGNEDSASGKLPLSNSGLLPMTNPGMDMSINPNLVGGVDGTAGAGGDQAPVLSYEEQLRIRTQEIQQKARDMGFEQIKKSTLPLETYEIRELLSRLRRTQKAIQTPIHEPPKPQNVVKTISLDPSAEPPVIHLATGNVSTISIVDVTGAPWPIVDLGFAGSFDVKAPEAGGNVMRIVPLKEFARGNLVLRLLKLTAPITFSLRAGQETVNYRYDARIPQYGPNAKMPLLDTGIQSVAGDRATTAFLEGVPPSGAKKLSVEGVDGRTSAYRYAGSLYVRTPLSLLSPAWNGSATSADGMNVYVLSETPVLLLSDQGTLVRAHLAEVKS